MTRTLKALSLALLMLCVASAALGRANRVAGAVWAEGELYDTVVTPTSFNSPPAGSTDIIYSFMMSGLAGQRSVAESAPGEPDFNGGRWDVHMAIFTAEGLQAVDPDGDGTANFELTSAEEVLEYAAMGYLMIHQADFYFECPLLPRNN
jgi:hypothetical protein